MQAFGHRAGFGKFVPWEFTETLQGALLFYSLGAGAGNIEVGIVGSAGNKQLCYRMPQIYPTLITWQFCQILEAPKS